MSHAHRGNKSVWRRAGGLGAVALAVVGSGCADSDNPTALADLNPITEFALEGTAETFREVIINVDVTESGARLQMSQAQIVVQSASGTRTFNMEEDEDGLAAKVTFFEEGIHRIAMIGIPDRHDIATDLGETEIMVNRYHEVAGPYWVEFATDPAPIQHGHTGHLDILVYDLLADGSRGAPVDGLALTSELHHPDGVESAIAVSEAGGGEYGAMAEFVEAGIYELNVVIDDGTAEFRAEFIFPVIDPEAGENDGNDETGSGDPHG
jgi:hypothetical protein